MFNNIFSVTRIRAFVRCFSSFAPVSPTIVCAVISTLNTVCEENAILTDLKIVL